jgi:CTP synthase (UTP-ammonia lyase)
MVYVSLKTIYWRNRLSTFKRKRNSLPLSKKYEIVKLSEQNVKQCEIVRRYGLRQSTISTILRNSKKIKENYEMSTNHNRKRHRCGMNPEIDGAVREWFETARLNDVPINGTILQEKATDFAKLLNKSDFCASRGWLSRWKNRENIRLKDLKEKKGGGRPNMW